MFSLEPVKYYPHVMFSRKSLVKRVSLLRFGTDLEGDHVIEVD